MLKILQARMLFVLSLGLTQIHAFATGLLCEGDDAVLTAPVADFRAELRRIKLTTPQFQAVPSDYFHSATNLAVELADLRAALEQSGKTSNEVEQVIDAHQKERTRLADFDDAMERWQSDHWQYPAATAETDDPPSRPTPVNQPKFPKVDFAEGLPAEFGDYLEGTIAWHNPAFVDKGFARIAWERILSRPPDDRHFKSTWAAYMLGRSWEKENPEKAIAFYQKTRALATAGFADNLGLAAASLGQEARLHLKQKDYEPAIELYLQQLAAGDNGAERSLITTVRAVVTDGTGSFPALAENPLTRRVITAYMMATKALQISLANVDAPTAVTREWLDACEAADVNDVDSIEGLALTAYQNEDWETAQHWIDRASSSPVTRWLQAKMLLRDRKVDPALTLLAQIVPAFPLTKTNPPVDLKDNLTVPLGGSDYGEDAAVQLRGEVGVLLLAHGTGDYPVALDWFLRAGLWQDAAYVAERILTVDELKAYVDSEWPALSKSSDDEPVEDPWAGVRQDIRYLLARRLTRVIRGNESRAYYPTRLQPEFDELAAALTTGWNESLPADQRSKALFAAACMMDTNGMNLVGTEVEPDWHYYLRSYQCVVSIDARTNESSTLFPASAEELRRAAEHHADPEMPDHYEYQAAFLAWEAAKLMPNNSDDTARVLCIAGTWLKYKDPDTADIFYKSLVRRNRKTEIGAAADERRWFPNLDNDGNLLPTPIRISSEESSESDLSDETTENENQMQSTQTDEESDEDEVFYVVQSGDTLARIANALGMTASDLSEANDLPSNRLKVGQKLKIPIR